MIWLIVYVWSMLEMILKCHDRLDWVESMTKTRQDNNVTDRIGSVDIKIETELSGPIRPSAVCN